MNEFIALSDTGDRALFRVSSPANSPGVFGVIVALPSGNVGPIQSVDSIFAHTMGQWDFTAPPMLWDDSWVTN